MGTVSKNITDKITLSKRDWEEYYRHKPNSVPRETLLKALEFFDSDDNEPGTILTANDLGCGHGSDTIELLKRGWYVTALDGEPAGIKILKKSINPEWKSRLKADVKIFSEMKLNKCNFVNASFSLPFCNPAHFNKLWKKIENSIIPDGRFAGNFFGKEDEWAGNKAMTFHTRSELYKFFENFVFEFFHERNEDGFTSTGEAKHWHVYSVIARKK